MKTKRSKIRLVIQKFGFPVATFAFVVLLWQLCVTYFDIPEYLVPTPLKLVDTINANFPTLIKDSLITTSEAFLGFIIANCISFVIAVVFCYSRIAKSSLYPYVIALKSVPIVAMAPLLIIWFGYGYLSKILMAAIIGFFPLVVNATIGLMSVNENQLNLMKTLSASEFQIFKELRLPSALPHIFSALKISAPLSVVGAVIAEMTGAVKGIGAAITVSSMNIDTPLLFASILFASLIGIFFFCIVAIAETYIIKHDL